jgi:hypothetical protein
MAPASRAAVAMARGVAATGPDDDGPAAGRCRDEAGAETGAALQLVAGSVPTMEGTRIVLVRHGESRAQELRIVGGHKGCQGLSDRGRRQVEALRDRWDAGPELDDDPVLYASVMPRAVETATILAPALGAPKIAQDCDLCEHHPGEGDGLPWDEFDELRSG